jgi:hypothetical protein
LPVFTGCSSEKLRIAPDQVQIDTTHLRSQAPAKSPLSRTDLALNRTAVNPFLLFYSEKPEIPTSRGELIRYLVFLCDKAKKGAVSDALLRAWYCFPKVKQTWLWFSLKGNHGTGLGCDFARVA